MATKPKLELHWGFTGYAHVASIETLGGSRTQYRTRRTFAVVRPQTDGNGVWFDATSTPGWVVATTNFDDAHEFPTLEQAKLHVEALFALDSSG